MATITSVTSCRNCGQMMSSTALKCGACGAPMPKRLSTGVRAILVLDAAILLGLTLGYLW